MPQRCVCGNIVLSQGVNVGPFCSTCSTNAELLKLMTESAGALEESSWDAFTTYGIFCARWQGILLFPAEPYMINLDVKLLTPGLQLWLDATDPLANGTLLTNGTPVTTWYDKSGNLNNATGGVSPFYANNSLVFNGASFLDTTLTARPMYETIFVVFLVAAPLSGSFYMVGTNSQAGRGLRVYNNNLGYNVWGVNGYSNTSGGISRGITTLVSGTISGGPDNGVGTTFINGGNYISQSQIFTTYGEGNTRIGAGNGSDFFNGTISEVLIYNRSLSTSERQRVEGYLAWKWRLNGSLPSTHQYYNSFDVVVKEIAALTNLPTFITSVNQTNTTISEFTINWSGGNNTTYYTYIIDSFDRQPSNDQGITSQYATFNGFTAGTVHSVIITAFNSAGFRSSSTFQAGTAPSQPISLNETSASETGFTINWSPVIGATNYIYTLNEIVTVPTSSTSTSASFSGLSIGTGYTVIVTAVNPYASNSSAAFSATTRPSQPTSLNLTNGSETGFTINWSGGLGATSYTYTLDGNVTIPNSTTSTSATFTDLLPGTSYAVIVTANNVIIPSASNVSATFTARTTPSKPRSLVLSNILINGFTVSWTGGLSATSYTYTLNGSSVVPSNDQGVASNYAVFSGLLEGTSYVLIVSAVNTSGFTSSTGLSVSTLPGVPVNVVITNISLTGFQVNWSGGLGATSYSYQLNGLIVIPSNDQGLTSKYAVFTGLLAGTKYNVIVIANNVSGVTPSGITFSGVNLWLDGANPLGTGILPLNNSVLPIWYDISTNEYNATGVNSPIYTTSGISFNGTSQYYTTTYTSIPTTESIFVVYRQKTTSYMGLVDTSRQGGRSFMSKNPNGPSLGNSQNAWYLNGSYPISINTTYIAECLYNSSGVSIYINGNVSSSNTSSPSYSAGVTYIGGANYNYPSTPVDYYLNGTISEVIIFNSLLSTTNRQEVEGYLAWKWGLQSTLPISHPYYITSPTWGATVTTIPSQPASLSLTNGSDTGFTINWTQGKGASSYSYTMDGSPVTPSIDLGVTSKSASFSGLTIGTYYQIVVTAINVNGSTSSATFTATTKPSKATSLIITSLSSTSFTANWSGALAATSYTYTLNDSPATPSNDQGLSSRSATFSGLSPNTLYTLIVIATNISGSSVSGDQFNPTSVPGIQTWLDATDPLNTGVRGTNSQSLVTWYDKSGKGNNMTFSGPSITYASSSVNSLDTIYANGTSGAILSIPINTFVTNYCGFIVLTNTVAGQTPISIFDRRSGAQGVPFLQDSGGSYTVGSTSLGNPTEFISKGVGTILVEVLITTYASTGGTGNFNCYINGAPITFSGGTVTGLNAVDTARASISFAGPDLQTANMNTKYCEIIMYNSNLSIGNRQKIEGYLAQKWGLQNKPMFNPSTYLFLTANATDTGSNVQAVTNNNVVFSKNNYKASARLNNSTNTYLSLPFPYRTGSFTISYWFNATDAGYYDPWALSNSATGAAYGINPDYVNGTQNCYMAFSGGTLTVPSFVYSGGVGTWNHFALTVNSTNGVCQMYGNGVLKSSATGSGTLNNSAYLLIGKAGDNGRAFNGAINNFAIYNSALSSSQISDIYNSQVVTNSLPPTHPYYLIVPESGLIFSTLPTTPSSFSLTNTSDTGFTINWAVGTGATNYTFTLDTVSTVPSLLSTSSATFTGLLPGTLYSVIVTAINSKGGSVSSAPYNAGTAPGKPTSVTISNLSATGFQANWIGGLAATSYSYSLNGSVVTPSDDKGLTSKYAIFSGLTANTSYTIIITAVNNSGTSSSLASISPSLISGLQVWLDGNDPLNTGVAGTNNGTLTTWFDKSGNSRNMTWTGSSITYANSSINSLNTIYVNGTTLGTVSIPTGAFPSNYCGFIVIKNTLAPFTLFSRTDTNAYGLFDYYGGSTVYVSSAANTRTLVGNTVGAGAANPYLSSFLNYPIMMDFGLTNYAATGGTGVFNKYYNGLAIPYSGGQTTGLNVADTLSPIIYFGGRAGVSYNHNANYCEILLFNTNITIANRQILEGYLAWKWGLQSVRPYVAQTVLLLNDTILDTGSVPQTITNSAVSIVSILTNPSKKNSANFTGTNYLSLPFTYGTGSFSITYWSYSTVTTATTAWSLSTTQSGASGVAGINAQVVNGVQHFYLTFTGGIVNAGNWSAAATSAIWYQSVLTVNPGTGECKSYLNGVLKNTVTGVGTLQNTPYMLIGKNGNDTQGFNGYINNFAVYNYVLTQSQITTIFNSESIVSLLPSSHPYYSSAPVAGVSLITLGPQPTSLSLTSVTTTGFTVNWLGTSGVTNFTYTLNGITAVPASSTSTSATFTGLSPGTAYAIIVSSVNSGGSSPSASFAGSTLPSQPTTLSSSSISSTGFTVSWTAGAAATSYTYTLNGSSTVPSNDQGLISKTATFTGLSGGTTYAVIVIATNAFGSTASASFNVLTTPGQPTSLNATNVTSAGFTVNWSGASGATSYTYTIDGTTKVPTSSTSTSATFTGLLAGTSYAIIVTGINTGGSTASSSLSVLTLPSVPFNVSQTTGSLTAITVSWLGGFSATSYTYTLNGTSTTPSDDQGVANKYAVFTGLTSGTVYSIVVTAVNSSGSISSPPSVSNVSGQYLWIDGNDPLGSGTLPANNSTISTLYDKSGNSRNLSVTNPATPATFSTNSVNGLANLVFANSVYRSATLTGTVLYPFDVYLVLKLNSVTAATSICSICQSNSASSYNALSFSSSKWSNASESSSRTTNTVASSTETSTGYILIQWTFGNSNFNIYRNGSQIAYTSTYTYTPPASLSFLLGLSVDNTTTGNFNGAIAEIVAYNTLQGTTNRQFIEGALAWKWGIQTSLSVVHPYYSTRPAGLNLYTAPSAPVSLNQTNGSTTGFTINWTGASGATRFTYILNGVNTTAASSTATSATFTGLTAGTSYTVIVNAFNGPVANTSSDSFSAITSPTPLTGILSSNITSTGFTVSWSGGASATSYTYLLNGSFVTPSVDNGLTSQSATFSGLTPATSYNVVINAVNASGTTMSDNKLSNLSGGNILQNWYDGGDPLNTGTAPANAATVSIWYDKSSKSNNLNTISGTGTFSSNSLNGMGTMSLNGSTMYRAVTGNAPYPVNVFLVVKLSSLTRPHDVCALSLSASDNFNSLTFGQYTPGRWHNGSSGFGRTPLTVASSDETSTGFLLMHWSIADNNYYIYRNGVQISQTSSYTWAVPANEFFQIGARTNASTGNNMSGSMAEVLVYNNTISSIDRQLLEGYLAWKWGLQASLPLAHPYYTGIPVISVLPRAPVLNLQLWLDGKDPLGTGTPPSSGATVSTWADKSGNGYNTSSVVGTPTYSPTSGIVLNGSSYFNLPNGSIPFNNTSYSIYSVINFSSFNNTGWFGAGANATNQTLCMRIESGTIRTYWYQNDIVTTSAVTAATTFLFDTQYQTGGQRTLFTSGTAVGSDTPGTRSQPNTGNLIGKTSDGLSMTGSIAEILVYNVNHTTTQRQQVEGYLSWKWNIQSQLPVAHPYYSVPYAAQGISTPPSAPTALASSEITTTSFKISWSGGTGATNYTYTLNGVTTVPGTNAGMASKYAIFTGLTAGQTYSVVVIGTFLSYTVTSSSFDVVMPPSIPVYLSATSITSSGFTVNWSGGVTATSYTYLLNGSPAIPSVDNGVTSKSATFSDVAAGTSFIVVITAINASGSNSAGNQVKPSYISGLTLWLDAADPNATGVAPALNSSITSWKDKTSNGNHYTTTGATYAYDSVSGKNAILFSGSAGSGAAQTNTSLSPFANTNRWTIVTAHRGTNSAPQPQIIWRAGSNVSAYWVRWYNNAIDMVVAGGVSVPASTYDQFSGVNCQVSQGTSLVYSINGTASSSIAINDTALGSSRIEIAAYMGGTTLYEPLYGYMDEVLIFNTNLSPTDRQKIEGYLAWKWNTQAKLPVAHPHYLLPPQSIVTPASAPTALALSEGTSTSFKISWSGGTGATSYTYLLNSVTTVPSSDAGVASKYAIFTGLTGGTTYTVVVNAVFSGLTTPSASFNAMR